MIGKLINQVKSRRILRQASRDVLQVMAGRMDVRDVSRVEQLGDKAQYQQQFLFDSQLMADLTALEGDADLLAVVEKPAKARTPVYALRHWPALAAAAGLLLAVGLVFQFAWQSMQQSMQESQAQSLRYITRIGERKTVNLSDGSIITLNTDTQLMVSYSSSFRDVALLKGEAYFEVAADPTRPFGVALGSRDVTVLGTRFNIRKTPEKFTLAVMEGEVALHPTGESASRSAAVLSMSSDEILKISHSTQRRLRANTVVEFDERNQELTAYLDPDIDKRKSWEKGYLRFVEAPLSEVLAELNRYSGKPIVIRGDDVAKLRMTGTLRLDQISRTLQGIETSLPIKVVHLVDRIEITAIE